MNAALMQTRFWDGRVPSQEEQAKDTLDAVRLP